MENFEEYLRQGEPDRSTKAQQWQIAIGLQQVDGLQTSEYLISTAKQNIEGKLNLTQVKQLLNEYYQQQPVQKEDSRTEEADKVSARVAEILQETSFSFSPAEYLSIHRRLFKDIYPFAGVVRDYNITKKEWVLNGETVLYGSAKSLMATLEYDFEQEKKFNYQDLSIAESIAHLAHFTAYLWQIHLFGEGNTRTTAVFLIKYLRNLGFKQVNNTLFAEHSWYFRNALVRANYQDLSQGIHKSLKYLVAFLENLLLGKNHLLQNRKLHINYTDTLNDSVNPRYNTVLSLIKDNNRISAAEISQQLGLSLSTVERKTKALTDQGWIHRIGSDKTGHWHIVEGRES